jgi:hypothetical protein
VNLRPRLAATLLLALAASGLAACSTTSGGTPVTLSTTTTVPVGEDGPTTTTTAEPPASAGKELYVYAPVEGDCIDLRATGQDGPATTRTNPEDDATPRGENELILRLPCDLPHQYEVISVVTAEVAGDTDDDAAYLTLASTRCPAAFATYIGTPYQDSELEVGWVLPAPSQRAQGGGQIGCLAYTGDGKLTGTVRGSRR